MGMEPCQRIDSEQQATQAVRALVQDELGEVDAATVAGACMRVSVALAVELFGQQRGREAARQALEHILTEQIGVTLQ